ncbi:MAG: ribosome small subunit-dependent GTPase A [Planctomycetaceae bacterium]|nr:ribosome small subunit-dependent GTPase A [Planctomycetaceae bacterium]
MSRQHKRKIRVAFSKNRKNRARSQDITREILRDSELLEDASTSERISGKGALTRHRTIIADGSAGGALINVDPAACPPARVLYSIGANRCRVRTEAGEELDCTVRRVLRTLDRSARNTVVPGDHVSVRPLESQTGVVERVEPRHGVLSRHSGRKEHVIAANVDQAVIVVSAAEPPLKPGVVDRFIVSAERGGIRPVVCINKVDLVDAAQLQPVAGIYAQLGYDVVLVSALHGAGVARLRALLRGRQSVVSGQSGVGKSSLLNAVEPLLARHTSGVSADSGKGRHTTRVAEMLPLDCGGWVIDTPGIRQLELWDVIPEEVEGYFREFRPFVAGCKFPDCSHLHETGCAVRAAVDDRLISRMRYASYTRIVTGDEQRRLPGSEFLDGAL